MPVGDVEVESLGVGSTRLISEARFARSADQSDVEHFSIRFTPIESNPVRLDGLPDDSGITRQVARCTARGPGPRPDSDCSCPRPDLGPSPTGYPAGRWP